MNITRNRIPTQAAPTQTALEAAQARIVELEREVSQLQFNATHDELTGLLNRRALFDETPAHAFVTGIDLDGLKHANDTYGHEVGDLLILDAALRLQGVANATGGAAYRLGGDEFILLSATDPTALLDQELTTASYGVQDSTGNLARDIAASDVEMYRHKAIRKGSRA